MVNFTPVDKHRVSEEPNSGPVPTGSQAAAGTRRHRDADTTGGNQVGAGDQASTGNQGATGYQGATGTRLQQGTRLLWDALLWETKTWTSEREH